MPIPNPVEKIKRRRTSSFFKEESTSLQNGSIKGLEHDEEVKRKPQEPVLLVCLVNKKDGAHFEEKDVDIVRECFQ